LAEPPALDEDTLVLDEDVVVQTWALLEARRQEWAEEDVVHTTDFDTYIRGGLYVQANRGQAYDCIFSRPCSEAGRSWNVLYCAHKSSSFAYKKYGEVAANMLAMGWCHKMQYLFDLYTDSRQDKYIYQGAELDAYAPDPAYIDWLLSLPVEDPAWSRHEEIKAFRPLAPRGMGSKASASSG
jgi:hypothetical protein